MVRKTRKSQPTRSMVVRGNTRRAPQARGPTRSQVVRGDVNPMTIPALRRAFEHIDRVVAKRPTVAQFQKEWKKTFGKSVTATAAKDYLHHTGHAMKGGAASPLGGASLDYELAPTVNGSTVASVAPYVSSGSGVGTVPGFISQCGKVDSSTPVPADMGSNKVSQKGGKHVRQRGGWSPAPLSDAFSQFVGNTFPMGSPPTMAQDLTHLSRGGVPLPSPNPTNNPLNFSQKFTPFGGNAATTSIIY